MPFFTPSSPRFSDDGRYLFIGNRAAETLVLVALPDTLFQQEVGLVPALIELDQSGNHLLMAERTRRGGARLGRLEVGSWESAWKTLELAGPLVDLALSPRGDRVYLAEKDSSAVWYVGLSELTEMKNPGATVEEVGRLFLPSGPAQEIEILGDGDRLLAVSQEGGPGSAAAQSKGQLAAELTLLNPYRGTLVDWYWSQSGRGTASVAAPGVRFGDPYSGCVLALEDVTFDLVAYRFDSRKGRLKRKPDKLWTLPRPDSSQLGSDPRLVVAKDGGGVAIFAPGGNWMTLLETTFEEAGGSLLGHQAIEVPHAVSAVALSRNGCLAAAVGPGDKGEGHISIYRCHAQDP